MTAQPTKLRSELDEAKRHLRSLIASAGESTTSAELVEEPTTHDRRPALSKLNTLLGTTTVPQRSLALFQTVGVAQRPTYDLIAERVLGPKVGEPTSFLTSDVNYANHVAERLVELQRRMDQSPPSSDNDEGLYVGVEDDGTPVWSQVLNQQRGRMSNQLDSALAPPDEGELHHPARVLNLESVWPKRMVWSTSSTFKQWFVSDENAQATRFCERVIDRPGSSLNPLFIHSAPQAGCSHLIHATGQALLRREEGHVLHITAADATLEPLETAWGNALPGATALMVDDVHDFAHRETWSHQLGVLLDQALNHGLQVVVGGRDAPEDLPPSRLKDVLRASSVVNLRPPQPGSLLAFGRWRCAQKNLLVSDQHLAQISRLEPAGWRAMESRLERLSLAFEDGAVLLDGDDATVLLEGQQPQPSAGEQQRVDDLAAQLVGDAIDAVYSSVVPGGVDLHAPLQAWDEDDYVPPKWDGEALGRDSRVLEQRLRDEVDPIEPGRPSVLDVNEREKYIVRANDALTGRDVGRAVEVLVDIDASVDERMNATTSAVVSSTLEMQQLEERMVTLARRAVEADIEELIDIADELRVIEERLVELDPDRRPLPPLETDEGTLRDDGATLDEYEPEGEWNIDGTGVEPEVLLEDSAEKTVVHLSRIRPRNVLVGEEE